MEHTIPSRSGRVFFACLAFDLRTSRLQIEQINANRRHQFHELDAAIADLGTVRKDGTDGEKEALLGTWGLLAEIHAYWQSLR